jgi:hypothetical protein
MVTPRDNKVNQKAQRNTAVKRRRLCGKLTGLQILLSYSTRLVLDR